MSSGRFVIIISRRNRFSLHIVNFGVQQACKTQSIVRAAHLIITVVKLSAGLNLEISHIFSVPKHLFITLFYSHY